MIAPLNIQCSIFIPSTIKKEESMEKNIYKIEQYYQKKCPYINQVIIKVSGHTPKSNPLQIFNSIGFTTKVVVYKFNKKIARKKKSPLGFWMKFNDKPTWKSVKQYMEKLNNALLEKYIIIEITNEQYNFEDMIVQEVV